MITPVLAGRVVNEIVAQSGIRTIINLALLMAVIAILIHSEDHGPVIFSQTRLTADGRTWSCSNGHSYDQARQGYLNLLLVQHKNSRQPGDTPTMLGHRQAFLDGGHYQPVSDQVNRLLEEAKSAARSLGVPKGVDPFMTLSFMSLPVIPTLRVTTKGVFDVESQKYISQ